MPSSALKNRVLFTWIELGLSHCKASASPGLISLTRTVPDSVPSLFHSSSPTDESATKNNVPFTSVKSLGALDGLPGLRTVRLFAGSAGDNVDYVGVVEASSELSPDVVEVARYSSPTHPCTFAHAFVPVAADVRSASRA